jgi:serine/threonine protein phosphatase PrpC
MNDPQASGDLNLMERVIDNVGLELQPAEGLAAHSEAETMDLGAQSDVGLVRSNNEDNYLVAPDLNLLVLSDGMGAMASGEIASRLTVETIHAHCRDASSNPFLPLIGKRMQEVSEASNRLASAVQLANRAVYGKACENPSQQKMGATVVAVHYIGGRLSVAHVGDSRAYRLRGDYLEQLTRDHSFIAELRQQQPGKYADNAGNMQHLLTRAVGIEPEVEVEVSDELILESDIFLLCSDGLTHEVSDEEISWVLRDAENAQVAAEQLIALANESGGHDNITAIVIRQAAKYSAAQSRIARMRNWFRGRKN